MNSCVSIFQRTEKNDDNPYGLVEKQTISAEECCVVYLGGDGAINNKAINGYAKIIKNEILAPLNLDVAVYSIKYDFDDGKKGISRQQLFSKYGKNFSKKNVDKYNSQAGDEENNPQYIEDLYKKVIESRISENDGQSKLDVHEATRRLRGITFIAHCHGGFTALKLEELMQKKMGKLGYSIQEKADIQKQMLVVAHAPGNPLGVSKSTFISFMSVDDIETPRPFNYFSTYIETRRQENNKRYYAEKDKEEDKIRDNRWFDLKPSYLAGNMGNMFLIKQKHEYSPEGPAMIVEAEHNDVSYSASNQTKDGKMMAHFSKSIISNGIRNSLQQANGFTPLPPLEELIISGNQQTEQKEKTAFAQMCANGQALQKEIYLYARQMNMQQKEK